MSAAEIEVQGKIKKGKKKKKTPIVIDAPPGAAVFQLPKALKNFTGVRGGIMWENGQTFIEDATTAAIKGRYLRRYYQARQIRRAAAPVSDLEEELVQESSE